MNVDTSRQKWSCRHLAFFSRYIESCFDIGFVLLASRPRLDLLDTRWSLAVRMGLVIFDPELAVDNVDALP